MKSSVIKTSGKAKTQQNVIVYNNMIMDVIK